MTGHPQWAGMLAPAIPVAELALRTALVYGFLVLAIRWAGRRELGQMTVLDLVTVLVVSNAVQNAMVGPDQSLTGGLVSAGTLLAINSTLAAAKARSSRLRRMLEGVPVLLIHDGAWIRENLRRENLGEEELFEAMREHGVERADQVHLAVLELDGSISIVPRSGSSEVVKTRRKVRQVRHP